MSLVIKFYFIFSMLNIFRTLIHPSSGACDFSIVSPHWLCIPQLSNDARSNIHKTQALDLGKYIVTTKAQLC